MPRGQIRDRDRSRQINDFTGLKYGNITPTDIDGLIEYHNKAYVFIEMKYGNTKLPDGQKWALERLNNDLTKSGKPTITIIGTHQEANPEKDINVANTSVKKYYTNRHWCNASLNLTIKKLIDGFLESVNHA